MREKETYREHLTEIRERFGEAELLPLRDVAKYLGVDVRSLMQDHTFPVKKLGALYKVSAVNLARWLAA